MRHSWSRALAVCLFGVIAFIGLPGCILMPGGSRGLGSFDISPDGRQIVFASADYDLFLLDLKTLQVSQLTKTTAKEGTPAFSPDGKSIVYAVGIEGRKGTFLSVRSLDGKQVRQLTDEPGARDAAPCYSSDGSQIVFARAHLYRPYSTGGWTWDDWDLYLIKLDGTQLRRVTHEKYYGVSSPKFLPDGRHIVYSADPDRPAQHEMETTILVVDVSGEQPPKQLRDDYVWRKAGGAWGSGPNVSSDGSSITFISDRVVPYRYDVFVMNRDGTNLRPLGVTTISRYNSHPVLMPDGKSVVFLADNGKSGSDGLWQVDTDGKNPHRIAGSELFNDPLRWKPNQ